MLLYIDRLVGFARSPLGVVPGWLSIGALLVICVAGFGGLRATVVLAPGNIRPELGHAYVVRIVSRTSWLVALPSDPKGVVLKENANTLGPGGQLHQRIRDFGGGLYALNSTDLRFSTSNNSDPRTNGRVYRVDVPVMPGPLFFWVMPLGLMLAVIRWLPIGRKAAPYQVRNGVKASVLAVLAISAGGAASISALATLGSIRFSAQSLAFEDFTSVAAAMGISMLLAALEWPATRSILMACYRSYQYFPAILTTLAVAPYILLRILSYLSLAACFIYFTCSLIAFIAGWALPTTALIRWSLVAQWMAHHEQHFGFVLLTCAALGTTGTFIARLVPVAMPLLQEEETALLRFVRAWGFVIVAGAFVFSLSTMWAGIITPGQFQWASIGGLVPFSDAGSYAACAYDAPHYGILSQFCLRRPIAAAFRIVLSFFSGHSYSSMLLVQALLLSALLSFAAWAIISWRGLWAGVAFSGLVYIYARSFMPTILTEPLGIMVALFSIPFLIAAFRTQSLSHALLALMGITIALLIRMGAMFTIPALIIWIFWNFGRSQSQKMRAGITAMLVALAVFSANFALAGVYGAGPDNTGSNFAYVLCGLTLGTTYQGCPNLLHKEGKKFTGDSVASERFFYAMAWQNFKRDPGVLPKVLLNGAESFLVNLPDRLFRGYGGDVMEPSLILRYFISFVCIAGLIFFALSGRGEQQFFFWALFWLSVVASSAVVYYNDGDRVLAVSYIMIFLFFALGFRGAKLGTTVGVVPQQRLRLYGIASFSAMAFLCFSVPWLSYRLSRAPQAALARMSLNSNQVLIYGGPFMTGFLVVPDGAPLRSDVPTFNLTTFRNIVKQSGVEHYQGLVTPNPPSAPFGFVFAARAKYQSGYSYIVPPEVIERKNVRVWRIDLDHWHLKPPHGSYWFYVTHAEPLKW